jgi:hypothetical protein
VIRRDGREAAAADRCDAAPFRFDTTPRLEIVRSRNEMLLARADLERERALTRLG